MQTDLDSDQIFTASIFWLPCLYSKIILSISKNSFYPDKSNIFLDYQKGKISKVDLESSIQTQYMAGFNFQCRSKYYLDI